MRKVVPFPTSLCTPVSYTHLIVREFEPAKGFGSGLTIDRDPAFQEMVRLAELGGHGIRYLVIYDVSRFGRLQQEDKIYWERRLKKQGGIDIAYVKDEFKNDGSISDTLLKVVKHSEAHQFSLKLSEVTLRGAKSHAALGHSAGGRGALRIWAHGDRSVRESRQDYEPFERLEKQ